MIDTSSGPIACCSTVLTAVRTGSPGEALITLDYYEGPLEGFLRCRVCGGEFWFEPICVNEDPENRRLCLAPLPPGSIDALTALLECRGKGWEPAWSPLWELSAAKARRVAEAKIKSVIQHLRLPQLELVWTDDSRRILWARRC
jgi:hypothetical protein